jgi:hypothetical protein
MQEDPSEDHFRQAVTALKEGHLRKAERAFKAVLDFEIPGDVVVATYFSLGEIHYSLVMKELDPDVPLSGKKLSSAKKAYVYYAHALELSEEYPSSPNFPDYANALKLCKERWNAIAGFIAWSEHAKGEGEASKGPRSRKASTARPSKKEPKKGSDRQLTLELNLKGAAPPGRCDPQGAT